MQVGRAFFFINAALIAGIAIGSFTVSAPYILYIIAAVVCWIACFFVPRNLKMPLSLCVFACFMGICTVRVHVAQIEDSHQRLLSQLPLQLQGQITSREETRGFAVLDVKTRDGFLVRIRSFGKEEKESDTIDFICEEARQESSLALVASRGVLLDCGVSQIISVESANHSNVFLRFRSALLERIATAMPSPEAELLQGMLLGAKKQLPDFFETALQRTGTTHIVVLSGFNITILAFVILYFLRRLGVGLRPGAVASILIVFMFLCVTGFSTPAIRAGIMASGILVARALGRNRNSIHFLGLSAGVMLLFDPLLLRWSVSFELSFLATIGVLFVEKLSPSFSFLPLAFGIRENVRITFSATLLTLPILVLVFGQFSFVTLIVNSIILPLVPLSMGFGALILIFGWISNPIAVVLGVPSFVLLRSAVRVIQFFSELPFAFSHVVVPKILFSIIWLVSIAVLFAINKNPKKIENTGDTPLWIRITGLCLVGCFGVWAVQGNAQSSRFYLNDVGQGDSMHIRFSDGFDVLIDGGPDATVLSRLGEQMPYFDRTIELIILTHPHADHVSGLLEALNRYQVDEIWYTGADYDSPLYDEFLATAITKKIVYQGMSLNHETGDASLSLRVLWPPANYSNTDINQTSIAMDAEINGAKLLLMGDAGIDVEKELLAQGLLQDADILKAGHQGSRDASSMEFIEAITPETALISVGKGNQFGHPHEDVVKRLKNEGISVLQTSTCGTIMVDLKSQGDAHVRSRCEP